MFLMCYFYFVFLGYKDQIIVRVTAQGQRIARNVEATSIRRQATPHTPKYALTLPHSKSSVSILVVLQTT